MNLFCNVILFSIVTFLVLGERMLMSEFTFKDADLDMVDDVADAIKELVSFVSL